jgi:hypothetical protein
MYVTLRAKRVALVAAMGLVTLNIWTGAPLLALWVGSRLVQDGGTITMGAAAAVVITLGAVAFALLRLLGILSARYDEVTGRPPAPRQQAPWLRSLRGDRPHAQSAEHRLRPVDYVVVATVVLAYGVFEVWFFFFSGSPLGTGT